MDKHAKIKKKNKKNPTDFEWRHKRSLTVVALRFGSTQVMTVSRFILSCHLDLINYRWIDSRAPNI